MDLKEDKTINKNLQDGSAVLSRITGNPHKGKQSLPTRINNYQLLCWSDYIERVPWDLLKIMYVYVDATSQCKCY